MAKVKAAAAAKLKAEVAAKEEQAEKKRDEAVKEAALEYLCMQFGTKQKPPSTAVQEKLNKACRCHPTMKEGCHKGGCSFHPSNLRQTMRMNLQRRQEMEHQLRTRTSLAPEQRARALDHLFGPAVEITSASAASSGASGAGGGRITIKLKMCPLCVSYV